VTEPPSLAGDEEDPTATEAVERHSPGDATSPPAATPPSIEDVEEVDAELIQEIRAVARQEAIQILSMEFSGPLPPASEMERYSRVDPQLPARIEQASTEERQHRHKLELMTTKATICFGAAGHVVGAIFVIGALGVSLKAITSGQTVTGAVALVTAVVPIVLTMLRGGRDKN
jgi:uncharacterized membrane protein